MKTKVPVRRRKKKTEDELVREIRLAVETGEVVFGERENKKLVLLKKLKAIILPTELPKEKQEDIEIYAEKANIPVIRYDGTSKELGVVCGKPFLVSMAGIINEGNSKILKRVK